MKIWLAMVVVITMIFSSAWWARSVSTPEKKAYDCACAIVKLRLLTPSSATFQPFSQIAIERTSNTVSWISYLDSQNGFGARLRETWSVAYQPTADGKCSGLTIKLGDEIICDSNGVRRSKQP